MLVGQLHAEYGALRPARDKLRLDGKHLFSPYDGALEC